MERKLTTIVAMDVVGYSSLMERDEVSTFADLKTLRTSIVDPAVNNNGGRVVKLMGDGTLIDFPSVVSALECTIAIQKELAAAQNAAADGRAMRLRIGIHLGDVMVEGDDIYGDGVNVAARLETVADPGSIVISKQVHDQVEGKVSVSFTPLGGQSVKNIRRPIEAYSVQWREEEPNTENLRFGDFELDLARFELRKSGVHVPMEPQAFDLLVYLARHADRTVTKSELFENIWDGRIVSETALSSQIKTVRKAVGDDGNAQHTIRTLHGRGFRFVAELQSAPISAPTAPEPEEAPTIPAMAAKPSVAVLPFENLNRDPDEDYFADGISEDITTALSKNRWLTVIARNPAFAFRNSPDSIRTIGKKLHANYLVTGSVRKAGSRARISVQVVDAETEHSVWSERFDRDVVDIFDLQDEITELVTARIESELGLSEQRKAERCPRKNLGAWDLYQLGVAEFYKFTPEANERCQELLRRSIEVDPEFAGAYARLAYAIVLSMVYFDADHSSARMDDALKIAKKAIELDDQDANAYFTIGRVYLARREYDLAIDSLEHAVELNPSLAQTYCGLGDSLAYEGRLDEAIEQFEIAIRLSPHDPFRWAFFSYRSLAHLFRGEYGEAVTWARKATQIPNAQYWASAHLVAALGHLGDTNQIAAARAELLRTKPEFTQAFARKHLFYLKQENQMETYIDGLKKAGVE